MSENKVSKLKDALLDTLIDAVTNGVPVKDDETGEVHTAPCPANVLSVAAKVVKDFQDEAQDGTVVTKATHLSSTLKTYAERMGSPSRNITAN